MPNNSTPLELVHAVQQAFNAPGTLEVLERIQSEKLLRLSRTRIPKVINWRNTPNDPKYFQFKPPPGSLSIYWGKSGSSTIKTLEYGYIAHDIAAIEDAANGIVAAFRNRDLVSLDAAATSLVDAPSFFDLRYGRKTLAEALWAPAEGCGSMVLPYDGGPLHADDFCVVDYLKIKGEPAVPEVFIVLCPPDLNPLEIAAMAALPPDTTEMHIGYLPVACTVLVTVALFVAAVTIVTTCCERFHEKLSAVSLSPNILKELGPEPSISRLLRARTEIFQEFGVR